MIDEELFPVLTDWASTHKILHLYSRAIGVIPRVHAKAHPKWWHIALSVEPDGLQTTNMDLPGGGQFWIRLDLRHHKTILYTDQGVANEFDHNAGLTASQFGNQLLAAMGELGITGNYARNRFEDDDPRQYDPVSAERFFSALTSAHRILKDHRATLSGEVSPLNFWTHGFDLSFEWFGTRVETYEENGELQQYPAQINFGFYPGGDAYFYANPWPFEAELLLDKSLPSGASWHTEGWQGTILPYDELIGDDKAEARLREYTRAVFELSAPTLMAKE